jgi:cell division protein FtsL
VKSSGRPRHAKGYSTKEDKFITHLMVVVVVMMMMMIYLTANGLLPGGSGYNACT